MVGLLGFGRSFGLLAFWSFGLLIFWPFCLLVLCPFGRLVFWSFGLLAFGLWSLDLWSSDILVVGHRRSSVILLGLSDGRSPEPFERELVTHKPPGGGPEVGGTRPLGLFNKK